MALLGGQVIIRLGILQHYGLNKKVSDLRMANKDTFS